MVLALGKNDVYRSEIEAAKKATGNLGQPSQCGLGSEGESPQPGAAARVAALRSDDLRQLRRLLCPAHLRDRFAYSQHVRKGNCSSSRTIARLDLERQVLAGLTDRLLAPEAAAEAMRAYTEEINRRNQARRASIVADRHALAAADRAVAEIVRMVATAGP